jgi:hypothetical protein
MLQNRVDPFGNIIKTAARGAWMGNRGVIHNEQQQITHVFKHKAWITCALQFKGRKRTVMTPGRWTELFFLDEATAFAAGHRPCFECRKEDATRFKSCWIHGNPSYGFTMKTSIREIDEVIHCERIDKEKKKISQKRKLSDVPEGVFIVLDHEPYLFSRGSLHRWTPFGYENAIAAADRSIVTVLTPHSIVNAFSAGYVPEMKQGSEGRSRSVR